MSTRKEAIKQVLSERGEDNSDVENEMIVGEILMDAEELSNERYELTDTAILDVKEIKREIEDKRSDDRASEDEDR